jgi:hypothetical protein
MAAVIVVQCGQAAAFANNMMKEISGALGKDENTVLQRTLILGEVGALKDLSSINGIIELMSNMFGDKSDIVRQGAAIGLGSMSIGNTNFFLDQVFSLIKKSNDAAKFMYLSTLREIITIKPECLGQYINVLLPLYLAQAKSD